MKKSIIMIGIGTIWFMKKGSSEAEAPNPNILIVGTNAEYPPFSFREHNAIVGFDIDIINEVAKRIGKQVKLIDMPFDSLLPKLQLGSIEVVAAGLTATQERALKVLFTHSYFNTDPLIIVTLAKNNPTNVKDLTGKEVIVNEGYTADLYMSAIEGPIIKRLATPSEALMALRSGRAYAFVTAQSTMKPFFQQYGTKEFRTVPIENTTEDYALAVSKKFPELLTPIQEALNNMQQDGTLENLKKKWNLS